MTYEDFAKLFDGVNPRPLSPNTVRYWEANPQIVLKQKYYNKLEELYSSVKGLEDEQPNEKYEKEKKNVIQNFEGKLKSNQGAVAEFIVKAVALFMLIKDPAVPLSAKAIAVGALAYFIMPLDAIPDAIPGVGFADDGGVIAGAIAALSAFLTENHMQEARDWLQNF